MKIKYVGVQSIYYPNLPSFPRGKEVNPGDEFKVTDKEAKFFLRQKNGKKNLFIENKPTPIKRNDEIKDVSEE